MIQYFDIGPMKIMVIFDTVIEDDKLKTFFFFISTEYSYILVFSWRFV